MSKHQIWYSTLQKKYYTPDKLTCDKCEKSVENIAVQFLFWNKESKEKYTCMNCKPQPWPYKVAVVRMVILGKPPVDSFPVLERPPVLKATNLSSFEMTSYPTENITDNTRVSGRCESLEGASVGKPERLVDLDRPVIQSACDVSTFLDGVQTSVPVIESAIVEKHGLLKGNRTQ